MRDFKKIEKKWQDRWEKEKIFQADPKKGKKKFFVNEAYPYVNGEPHLGHGYSFMRADTYARFKRMQGFNVLFSQGFQATGEPILGVVERLKNNDKDQINALKLFGATDRDLKDFVKNGPEYVAKFWMKRWIEVLKSSGYSVDWRRTFITAIDQRYNRFIQWQYETLKKKGYVVQGTHPVVWCPHDQSPTGDHDRLVGEGESPTEFVMIKFRLDSGEVLPCATMRPETVYGATNVWLNPEGDYVYADVDGETWLVGKNAVQKLKDQLHEVSVKEKADPRELIGQIAKNPVTDEEVPVLPASFVDSQVATGVVMSVPSHAPYDWVGLHELQEDFKFAERFGLSREMLLKIAPISIIKVEGMGENPAVEVSARMMISKQSERGKLDEATKEVYKKEFHQGVLKSNTEYAGMKVSEAKEKIISDFIGKGAAVKLWEMTGDVVCRCKTRCRVKILENQWFLKFSDEKWKATVREAISRMNLYPKLLRTQLMNTVDWLKDKACARKSGLGAKLPWDKDWIIETLSDSVIYMAYYTIAHIVERNNIQAKSLTNEVFDYIFLGKDMPEKSEINANVLKKMREEFEYFYPTDVRLSAKELIQNHLTYHIFHHTAIWDNPALWTRGIAVNGFVTLGGEKMSKRLGNVTRFRDLIEKYGADITRMNLVGANENMDDADWREDTIDAFVARMKFLQKVVKDLKSMNRSARQNIDSFLASRIQKIISEVTGACEETRFRSAIQSALFESTNEMRWYIERCGGTGNCNGKVLKDSLSTVVRLLSPFMPHAAEELWEAMGNEDLVSVSEWPSAQEGMIDEKSELGENLVKRIIDDVREIEKISGIRPKSVKIIIAPQWKFDVYGTVLENRKKDFKEILGTLKEKSPDTVKYVQALQKRLNELSEKVLERQAQFDVIGEAREFIEKQVSAKVEIEDAEKSDTPKAKNADVQKPAILLI